MKREGRPGGRLEWIDALRALAVALVVWGHIHTKGNTLYFVLTSPVKIPLFFAITGYVFNTRDLQWGSFLKKVFFRLVIPWILFTMIWFKAGRLLVTGRPEAFLPTIRDFFVGKTYWYMPCCILAECIYFAIRKHIPGRGAQIAASLALTAAGLVTGCLKLVPWAVVNVALTAQAFILIGRIYRERGDALREVAGRWILPASLAVYAAGIALSLLLFPGETMDVHLSRYYSLPLCAALIVSGLLILFFAAESVGHFPRWICCIGENTLLIYLLHRHVLTALHYGLKLLHVTLPENLAGYGIEFVFAMAASTVCAWLIGRWCPALMGRGTAGRSGGALGCVPDGKGGKA